MNLDAHHPKYVGRRGREAMKWGWDKVLTDSQASNATCLQGCMKQESPMLKKKPKTQTLPLPGFSVHMKVITVEWLPIWQPVAIDV